MPQPWQYLSGSNLSLEDQKLYMTYRGDTCKEYQLRAIGEDLAESLGRRLINRFKRINLRIFYELDGCRGPCEPPISGSYRRIKGTGRRKKLQCLDDTNGEVINEVSCNTSFSKLINKGLKKKITCLSKINSALAAQVIGLITSNSLGSASPEQCPPSLPRNGASNNTARRLKIKCLTDTDGSLGIYGDATTLSKLPSMRILPPQCQTGRDFISVDDTVDTLLHETIHMLGYTHNEIPDPAYACSLACRSNLNVNRECRY